MKVAQVCGNFPPELRGGVEMVVAALGAALREEGLEVLVIAGSEKISAAGESVREDWGGLPVVRLLRTRPESDPTRVERPRIRTQVEELLVSERVDVVHFHHMASLSADLLRAAQALGIASVFTFHDLWSVCARFFRQPPVGVICPPGDGRQECVACVDRDLGAGAQATTEMLDQRDLSIRQDLAAARVLTAPSLTCAESIRRHLPWTSEFTEIEVIPHGLLRDVRRRPGGLPGRPFRVGTFGNLVASKGVEDVVRAAAGLPGVEVHLWGAFLERGFEEYVSGLARDLDVELVCHGPFDETMPHPAESLHLALFPSRCEETYGLVVDEALAHGVPVLVSARGAFVERRGQGGVEVLSGGAKEFGFALRGLVNDPESYAALAAAVPEELPTMACAAQQYRELYVRAQEKR